MMRKTLTEEEIKSKYNAISECLIEFQDSKEKESKVK